MDSPCYCKCFFRAFLLIFGNGSSSWQPSVARGEQAPVKAGFATAFGGCRP